MTLTPGGISEADVLELNVAEERVIGDRLSARSSNGRLPVDVLEDSGARRHP
jgi:hypothetical protein